MDDGHQVFDGGSIMKTVLTLLLLFVGWSSVVEAATGMEACTRHTPVGVACFCNARIVSHHQFPVEGHPMSMRRNEGGQFESGLNLTAKR